MEIEPPSRNLFSRQGAGVLVMAQDTGRVLALKRSDNVQQPRTWGVSGGKVEPGEDPQMAALRELLEEAGYSGPVTDCFPLKVFETPDGRFQFHNFLVVVPEEFVPVMDHESESFLWVLSEEWPEPRHFGMAAVLEDQESRNVIREIARNTVSTDAEQIRQTKVYPPVLYHLIHGEMQGDALLPSRANPRDPCPYVYATINPRETLPYLTPNGTRIVNAPIPGSDNILTIIPDREAFSKNGQMKGTLLRFIGEGFEQKIIDGEPSTQWVSPEPVPFSQMQDLGQFSMESAMHFGLQILFTKDTSEETLAKIDRAMLSPDFPHNLKQLIGEGTLIHENAVRNINPSAFLYPKKDLPHPSLNF